MLSLKFSLKLLFVFPFNLLYNFFFDYKNFNLKKLQIKWSSLNAPLSDIRKVTNDRSLKDLLNESKVQFPEISNEEFTPNSRWIIKAKNLDKKSPIIFFIHGGGFNLRTLYLHISGLMKMVKALKDPNISILGIDYEPTPECKFPVQLEQCLYVYHKLADQEGYENIILLGDSAGGNIELGLLYQIKHQLPNFLKIHTKPKAALIFSPFVVLHPERTGSYITNASFDYVAHQRILNIAQEYVDDVSANPLSSPSTLNDWEGVFPKYLFYHYGEREIMLDSLVEFAEQARIDSNDIYIEPKGVHVHQYFAYGGYSQEDYEKTPFCKNFVKFMKKLA